jgi:hypothetical protein
MGHQDKRRVVEVVVGAVVEDKVVDGTCRD